MANWYVKDLSKLTHVSVQTLHHYDKIDLLKPSLRLENGYRVYNEADLSRLQQIIALKFFGFELAKIKEMLATNLDVLEHLAIQASLLEQKANTLQDASQRLKHIVNLSKQDKSIPWKYIVETIEVYHMTQQLEKTWAGKALSKTQLEEYAKFSKSLDKRFSPGEKEQSISEWHDILNEINANVTKPSTSDAAYSVAEKLMHWLNNLYGSEHVELRNAIWEKGFQQGHGAAEHGLTPQAVKWLDEAFDHYYATRIASVLNQAGMKADADVAMEWQQLLNQMCGTSESLRHKVINQVLDDKNISEAAKKIVRG